MVPCGKGRSLRGRDGVRTGGAHAAHPYDDAALASVVRCRGRRTRWRPRSACCTTRAAARYAARTNCPRRRASTRAARRRMGDGGRLWIYEPPPLLIRVSNKLMHLRPATPADIPVMMNLGNHSATASHWSREQYDRIFGAEPPRRLALVIEEAVGLQ